MKQSVIHLPKDSTQWPKTNELDLVQDQIQAVIKIAETPQNGELVWSDKDQRLGLVLEEKKDLLFFDLVELWKFFSRQKAHKKGQPLVQAIEKRSFTQSLIWDVSVGSGRDLCHLLALGAQRIWAFERHPLVYALLFFEIQRLRVELGEGVELKLFYGEAQKWDFHEKADVIYYDPMYPEKKKKSALSRQWMEVFKDLVGEDNDESERLENWLSLAQKRVVLKRPLKAPFLLKKPSSSFQGATTRYDLYAL